MNLWEQHYYTWSTKSLSGNKVGLGIVAASTREDRMMRVMENQGAGSEVCRDEEGLTIERMSYSGELGAYIRTGATPCAAGADKRNNKFVHLYSLKDTGTLTPEEYLVPLPFQKEWNGEANLSTYAASAKKQKKGKRPAGEILEAFGLSGRLPELFCCIYRCLLSGEKPVTFVDSKREPEEFAEFARQMMILVHSMLPPSLRKEADYVSYGKEDSQEAHFLFRKEKGIHAFDLSHPGQKPVEYALLEREFYEKLAAAFLRQDDSFEALMKGLDTFLGGLSDKRNQLEKCVFVFMASEASRAKDKEAFFTGVERLMYWARKDESLIPALREATKELDFHSMEEEELLLYTNLLLTGAGGGTKDMAYGELNRMLTYYYRTQDARFDLILNRIRQKNHTVYEQILKENEGENGFTKKVLFQPIENKIQLVQAIKNHESFLDDEEYGYYVASCAYRLYRNAKGKVEQKEIAAYGKMADETVFVRLKQKDVKKVCDGAKNFREYLSLVGKMDEIEMEDMEETILDRYLELLESQPESFFQVAPKEWIRFVLKLTGSVERTNRSKAKEAVLKTRACILKKGDLFFLAEINQALKNHGAAAIRCPKALWDARSVLDFGEFYKKIADIGVLKCEESPVYLAMEVLYHFVDGRCSGEDEKKIQLIFKKKKYTGEDLLLAMAALWGKNENLPFAFFYPFLEEKLGAEEAAKVMDDAARGNEKAQLQWKEFEKKRKKEVVREEKKKDKASPIQNIVQDVLSESIWAVLLGIYIYGFVHTRELFQKKAGLHSPMKVLLVKASEMEANLQNSIIFSIAVLIGLVLIYLLVTCLGRRTKKTPGATFYVFGLGIFLANLALSFESQIIGIVLFAVSGAIALALKLFSVILGGMKMR